AVFFRSKTEPGSGNRISRQLFSAAFQGQFLRADRNMDGGLCTFLHWRVAVGCAVLKGKSYHIAIAGATGAVGAELLRVLERRGFPVERLLPLSSTRSAGKTVSFRGEEIGTKELSPTSFRDIDLAFFSAGGAVSRHYAPIARAAGAIVID